jgi:beta-glucosidase
MSEHGYFTELLTKLSLKEKASLCSGLNDHFTKPIERLDIPSVEVTDGPHGLRRQIGDDILTREKASCFPAAVATASSWNPQIAEKIGVAIGAECREARVSVILGPAMNIKRSPLCGRNFEYFSEDPHLSGKIAAAYVRGVQSRGVGACLKHFAANNQEYLRMSIDARVDERALREIYLKGFEIAVKESEPMCVMAAYNRINGVFCTENALLLTDILRDEWGFDGIVMSDWGAVNIRENALKAGMDLEMPSSKGYGDERIVRAVEEGLLDEKYLDAAVLRMLKFLFQARENLDNDMYSSHLPEIAGHHDLAREVAKECIILLKNEGAILPLSASPGSGDSPRKKLAIIGGMAKHPRYQGGGSSNVYVERYDVPYDEIVAIAKDGYDISYAEGYPAEDNDGFFSLSLPSSPSDIPDEELIDEAARLAGESDRAILFVGLPEALESEAVDRPDMKLPRGQEALVRATLSAQPNTIVVLNNGSPIEMPWADEAKGIVEGYVCGEGGAHALAQIIFGKVNPSAKLAETFAARYADTSAVRTLSSDRRETRYGEGIMVGYRYFDAKGLEPLFPFGHGLSYTTFEYSDMRLSAGRITEGDELTVSCNITNTGTTAGAEIVQFYVSLPGSFILRPRQELKAFSKVFLEPGETSAVTVTLDVDAFSRYDEKTHAWTVDPGSYEIKAAASSRDIRLVDTVEVTLRISEIPVFDLNTTLGEVVSFPVAKSALMELVTPFVATGFLSQMPGAPEEIAAQLLRRFEDMPLRSLTLISSSLSMQTVEGLVVHLNLAVQDTAHTAT